MTGRLTSFVAGGQRAGPGGGRAATGRHTETALRLTIADALAPGGLARVDLATATVGPNAVSLVPQRP